MLRTIKDILESALKTITSPIGGLVASILVAVVSALLFFSVLNGKVVERALKATITERTTQRNEARTERDTANQNLGQCKVQLTQLQGQVKDQNERITAVIADGKIVTDRARAEAARQRAVAEDARRAATAVLNGRGGSDKCLSAEAVLRGQEG